MSFTEDRNKTRIDDDEIEIHLSDIVQFFKNSRRRMVLGGIIGLAIGALYAFSKHNVYTSQVTVMPEIQSKGAGDMGGLGSLAGLAGISLDNLNASDAIRPDLYPNVLESFPFAISLLKQPVYSAEFKTKMPLETFIGRIHGDGIISRITNLFGGEKTTRSEQIDPKNFSQAIQVTKEQDELIKYVLASTTAEYDKKTGVILITANESDPVVAATVARLSLEYLTNYVTNYRTEKARKQVSFLRQQVQEAKGRYQSAELSLSNYRDRNRSLFLNTAKIDEQRLQADYLLAQTVYNDLSKQLEQAKIKVQEDTPVFKTLEPPTIPLRKSGPKRTLIMVGFAIGGILLALVTSVVRLLIHRSAARIA